MMPLGNANSEEMRNAIALLLASGGGGGALGAPAPASAALSPYQDPYQDIVDPSDPASYNSSIVDAYSNFGPPTSQLNPGDLVNPSTPLSQPNNTLEAPSPDQQMQGLPEATPEPGDPEGRGTLEASNPTQQALDAAAQQMASPGYQQAQHNNALNDMVQDALDNAITANITGPDAETTGGPFGSGRGFGSAQDANNAVQAALDSAISANIAGTTAHGMQAVANEVSNNAVSSALADAIAASSNDSTGGFGTGTGFSSADAANSAVSGALADAGDAAGIAGLGGVDAGPGGDAGGGGGAGGGSGK